MLDFESTCWQDQKNSPPNEIIEFPVVLISLSTVRVVVKGGFESHAGRCGGGVPAVRDASGAAEALCLLHPADRHQVLHPTLH